MQDVPFYHNITITMYASQYIPRCMPGICVPRRILLPPSEPLSPVRSQGPKVVQTGHKLLEMGPSQKVVQYSKTECASWAKKY